MVVHSVILLPGETLTYFCKDGLSPLDAQNGERIFNFGGTLKAVDCGVPNEWASLHRAVMGMIELANSVVDSKDEKDIVRYQDYYTSKRKDQDDFRVFLHSDGYQKWIAGKTQEEDYEIMFQALSKQLCGYEYTGPVTHHIMAPHVFKLRFCPEAIERENLYFLPEWDTLLI